MTLNLRRGRATPSWLQTGLFMLCVPVVGVWLIAGSQDVGGFRCYFITLTSPFLIKSRPTLSLRWVTSSICICILCVCLSECMVYTVCSPLDTIGLDHTRHLSPDTEDSIFVYRIRDLIIQSLGYIYRTTLHSLQRFRVSAHLSLSVWCILSYADSCVQKVRCVDTFDLLELQMPEWKKDLRNESGSKRHTYIFSSSLKKQTPWLPSIRFAFPICYASNFNFSFLSLSRRAPPLDSKSNFKESLAKQASATMWSSRKFTEDVESDFAPLSPEPQRCYTYSFVHVRSSIKRKTRKRMCNIPQDVVYLEAWAARRIDKSRQIKPSADLWCHILLCSVYCPQTSPFPLSLVGLCVLAVAGRLCF